MVRETQLAPGRRELSLRRHAAWRLIRAVSAPPGQPDDSLRTRSSLLRRVTGLDADSWEEFYLRYRPMILALALRSGLTPAEADEVVQDVFTRLLGLLPQFDPDKMKGSFRSWLLGQARWRIGDKFRERRHAAPAADGEATGTGTSPAEGEPTESELERLWDDEWQRYLLTNALRQVQERVSARHFQIFDLYYQQHWSVPRIALELGVNPVTVYVVTHRLTKQLQREVAKLREELG